MEASTQIGERDVGAAWEASKATLAKGRLGAGSKPDTSLTWILQESAVAAPGNHTMGVILAFDQVSLGPLLEPTHLVSSLIQRRKVI